MSKPKMYETGIRGAVRLALRLARARDKDQALRMAAEDGDLEEMNRLLEGGSHIDAKVGDYETTVLMEVSVQGNAEVMKFLIEKGANVNLSDKDGWTALMGATVQGHLGSVKLLLSHGAEVNAKNDNNETALMMAVKKSNQEIRDTLLVHGAV
jgi:uncharacterized protein